MTIRLVMASIRILALAFVASLAATSSPEPPITPHPTPFPDTQSTILQIMVLSERLERVRFRDVIFAATGKQVLRFNFDCDADRRVKEAIASASRGLIEELKSPEHPVHQIHRINEVSMHLENRLATAIGSHPGLACAPPLNAQGRTQRSGYPDLEIIDLQTGKVFYLDPKLHHRDSRSSAFRTFYYEAKTHTQKVNRDAVHLLIGIAHDGKEEGKWNVSSWSLVDLYGFELGFKAEFQASNRDLYREDLILLSE